MGVSIEEKIKSLKQQAVHGSEGAEKKIWAMLWGAKLAEHLIDDLIAWILAQGDKGSRFFQWSLYSFRNPWENFVPKHIQEKVSYSDGYMRQPNKTTPQLLENWRISM